MPTREKIPRPGSTNRQQVTKLRSVAMSPSTSEKSNTQPNNNPKQKASEQKYRISRWFFAAEDDPEIKRFIPDNNRQVPQKPAMTRLSHSLKTTHLSPSRPHKNRALFPHRNRHQPQYLIKGNNPKDKDCNPCNKVPWIPMSRTPAGISDQVLSLVTPPVLESLGSDGYHNSHHDLPASDVSLSNINIGHTSHDHHTAQDEHHDISLSSGPSSFPSGYNAPHPPSLPELEGSDHQPSIEISLPPSPDIDDGHSSDESHYGPPSAESNHPPPAHSAPPVPSYDSPLPPPELPTHYDSHPAHNGHNNIKPSHQNNYDSQSHESSHDPVPAPEPNFTPSVDTSLSNGPPPPSHFSNSPSPAYSSNIPVISHGAPGSDTNKRPIHRPPNQHTFPHPPPPLSPPGKYRTPLSFFPTKDSIKLGPHLQPPPPPSPPSQTFPVSFPKRPHNLFGPNQKFPQQPFSKPRIPQHIQYLPESPQNKPKPFTIPNSQQSQQPQGFITLSQYLVPPTYLPAGILFTAVQTPQNHGTFGISDINSDINLHLPPGSENIEVMPSSPSSGLENGKPYHDNSGESSHHDTISDEDDNGHSSDDQLLLPSGDNQNSGHNENENPPAIHSALQRPKPNSTEVEFVKSVQIANYVSSVEYPLEVIQSPYVDIPVSPQSAEHGSDISQEVFSNFSSGGVGFPSYENDHVNSPNSQNQHHILYSNNTDLSPHDISNNFVSNYTQYDDQNLQPTGNEQINNIHNIHPVYNESADNQETGIQDQFSYSGPLLFKNNQENYTNTGNNHQYQTTVEFQPSVQTAMGASLTSQQSSAHPGQESSLVHQINNLGLYKQVLQSQPGLLEGLKEIKAQNSFDGSLSPFPLAFPSQPDNGQNILLPTPFHVKTKPFKRPYPQPFNYIGILQHPPPPVSSIATFSNTFQPDQPSTFLNPPAYDSVNPVTFSPASDYTSWAPATLPTPLLPTLVPTSPVPPTRLRDNNAVGSFENSGLVPPPMAINGLNLSNKRTKQIQIIVPYTSNKANDFFNHNSVNGHPKIETTGWSPMTSFASDVTLNFGKKVPLFENCSKSKAEEIPRFTTCNKGSSPWLQQQEDYHQHEESKTVISTAAINETSLPNKNEILSEPSALQGGRPAEDSPSNIRDLLRGEEFIKNAPDTLNLLRLQKNIDEWTALEYSKSDNITERVVQKSEETATVPAIGLPHHMLVPSKKIPEAYLTTPPSVFDDFTGNGSLIATSVPRVKLNSLGIDNEAAGSVRYIIKSSVETKNSTPSNVHKIKKVTKQKNNLRQNSIWDIFESTNVTSETTEVETTHPPTTDLTTETTTFDDHTEEEELTSLPNWDELEVSISSITKEKVYVVTPVSSWTKQWTTPSPPPNHAPSDRLSSTPFPYTPTSQARAISTTASDVFPFRNGLHPPSEKKRDSPDSNYSPRFAVRPTPGTNTQRAFTVLESEDEDSHLTTLYPIEDNEIEYAKDVKPKNSTVQSTTESSASWGLTDLPTYTPPPGTRVHTYSGHSRVVTAPTVLNVRKKLYSFETKKQATSKSSTTTSTLRPRPIGILRKYRPDRHSYLWHFPELLTPGTIKEEETEHVKNTVVELKKSKSR